MSVEFINKQKDTYQKLNPCFCPAIQAIVYFNADGFNHLIYDRHRPRNQKEKVYRVYLVDFLQEVIEKAQTASIKTFTHPVSSLWVLDWVEVQDKNNKKLQIKVILRKQGNGNIFFWSVMKKRSK